MQRLRPVCSLEKNQGWQPALLQHPRACMVLDSATGASKIPRPLWNYNIGRDKECFACFVCMNVATACLFLTGLERVSLPARQLDSEFISGLSGHWIQCNRDSNVIWIRIILKMFYAVILYWKTGSENGLDRCFLMQITIYKVFSDKGLYRNCWSDVYNKI